MDGFGEKHIRNRGQEGANEKITSNRLDPKSGWFLGVFEPYLLCGGGCGNDYAASDNRNPEAGLGYVHSKAPRFCSGTREDAVAAALCKSLRRRRGVGLLASRLPRGSGQGLRRRRFDSCIYARVSYSIGIARSADKSSSASIGSTSSVILMDPSSSSSSSSISSSRFSASANGRF